ncbi:MAG: hypothetical protein CMB99_13680 [Flavobacteriaceae bacterium]|nr:hypothetical protein [Flavobacteriaceae bacterium]
MKLKFRILSIFLLTSFLAQLFLQLHHAFEDHNHQICHSKSVKHIHDKDVDCELHLYKNPSQDFISFEYQFFASKAITSADLLQQNFLKEHHKLSFSLRGPPAHVLS